MDVSLNSNTCSYISSNVYYYEGSFLNKKLVIYYLCSVFIIMMKEVCMTI